MEDDFDLEVFALDALTTYKSNLKDYKQSIVLLVSSGAISDKNYSVFMDALNGRYKKTCQDFPYFDLKNENKCIEKKEEWGNTLEISKTNKLSISLFDINPHSKIEQYFDDASDKINLISEGEVKWNEEEKKKGDILIVKKHTTNILENNSDKSCYIISISF